MCLAELKEHLFTAAGATRPDPLPHVVLQGSMGLLPARIAIWRGSQDGEYEVSIDSTLAPGPLTYGEYVVPVRSRKRC